MKPYKLTVSIETLEFFEQRSLGDRVAIRELFQFLSDYPHNCQSLVEHSSGRRHFVYLRSKFAIKFWIDESEREVKVIYVCRRDRR